MTALYDAAQRTLDKKFSENLREFLKAHKSERRFILISDYCVGNDDKPNDVIAFTIAPGHVGMPASTARINRLIPKDIKKTKNVTEAICGVLNEPRFFHVAFMLDEVKGLFHIENEEKKTVLIKELRSIIDMVQMWSNTQPEGRDKFNAQIKRFKAAVRVLEQKQPNVKLFSRMILTSFLAAVLSYYLSKEARCELIVWLADRDVIHDSHDRVYMDFYEIQHWGLCLKYLPEDRIPKVGHAIDSAGGKKLWYDPLIRLPDYIAGSVASWHMEGDKEIHIKHCKVLENVVADNPRCNLIMVDLQKGQYSFSLRVMGRKKSGGLEMTGTNELAPVQES